MFEAAELGRSISKEQFKAKIPTLRTELLETQRQLTSARFPVIVIFAGVDGAGKGETVNLLNEWMDPRWIVTRAYGEPSDEESERPEYWRYWRDLPPRGRIGLFLSSWYSRPILDRVYGRSRTTDFDRQLERIAAFERTLTDDGALILKFWMHLGKSAQKKRLKTLEKDPDTRWRVSKRQWQHWQIYGKFVAAAERALRRTSTIDAPWTIVEGVDEGYRSLTVAKSIRDAIRKALEQGRGERQPMPGATRPARQNRRAAAAGQQSLPATSAQLGGAASSLTILSSLDMSQDALEKGFREGAGEVPGPAESPAAEGGTEEGLDDPGVRRTGCGRQGRCDPAHHRRAGRAFVSGHPHRRANRRRTGTPLPLALLASPLTRRTADDLRSQLVRARAR